MRVKVLIVIVVALFFSCSGSKKIVSTKQNTKTEIDESSVQKYYLIFLEANRKKLLGDINGALALYYQCLEIIPESAAAMSEISKINEVTQNYEVAIKYSENAVQIDKLNKWYQIDLARLYILTNNYNKAILVYEELNKNFSNDLEIPYKLAALYMQVDNFKKGIELYDFIESKVGVSENISITKQQLYLQSGNKTKAYAEIQKLINSFPNEARYYGILAEMYTNDNIFSKADENYKKLFEIDSTSEMGQLSVIDFYRKKMDYESAFETIRKVILNNEIEFNQKVMVFVAMLNNQNEFNICKQELKDLILLLKSQYPEEKDGYTLYADYLIKMNLFDDAKAEISYILKNYEGNVILWEQLLSIYSFQADFENLYQNSKIAIDSFPDHTVFYLFNGVSATQLKKTDEAITVFKEGLKTVKNNKDTEIDFYTYLGEAYYEKGEYDKSDYYFDMVLKVEPNNLYVINNYSYYLSLRGDKLKYAETISKKTVLAEPKNSTYLDTYAWILFKLERYQDAFVYIKRAFENGGAKSAVIVEHYGDINYRLGNTDEALELWKLSKEIGNTSEILRKKIENKNID